MIVERTSDLDAVREILTHPEIWETIRGDYSDLEGFKVPEGENIYLMGYDEDIAIGLFCVHPKKDSWFCHVQVLPEHRIQHADEFGTKVIEWVWNNTEINKLRALIPAIYPNVKRFSELMGFKDEKLITDSYKKDGQLFDEWLIYIERGE